MQAVQATQQGGHAGTMGFSLLGILAHGVRSPLMATGQPGAGSVPRGQQAWVLSAPAGSALVPIAVDPPAGHIMPKGPWLVSPSLMREIPLAPSSKAVRGGRC